MHTVGYRDLRTGPISRNGGIVVEQGGIVDDTVASLSKVNTFSSVVGLLVFGKSVLLVWSGGCRHSIVCCPLVTTI